MTTDQTMPPESDGMSKKTMLKNTAWLTAASFGSRFIGYAAFVIMAWRFTKEEIGVWAILLSAYLFSEFFSNLGMDKILIRNAAKDKLEGETLLESVLTVKLLMSAVTAVIAFVCVYYGYPELGARYYWPILLSFAAVPFIAVARTLESWQTAMELMHIPAIAQILERCVLIALVLCFWFFDGGFAAFIALSALAPASRCLYLLRSTWRLARFRKPLGMGRILSESFMLFAAEIVVGIYLRIDLILVSRLDSIGAAGLYNAAYRVFEFFTALFSGFLIAIFPALSRKIHISAFKSTFWIGFGIICAAAGFGIVFRNFIMGVFGETYLEAVPAFVALMIALPLSYATSFLANSIVAAGKTKLLLVMAVVVVGSNVLLNYALIPLYSITGAGIAFVGSELLSTLVLAAFLMGGILTRPDPGESAAAPQPLGADGKEGGDSPRTP